MTEQTDDFRQQVEGADMSYPDAWRPDPGDALIAVVQGYDSAQTKWGRQHVANVKREDDGELLAVWLSHKVLREEFKDKRPTPGERIGIKYHGEHEQGGYAMYTLRVDRSGEDAVPDFERSDPPTDEAAVRAGNGGDTVADAVNDQQDTGGEQVDLPEGDPDREIPF
jgi:hypothetical protein